MEIPDDESMTEMTKEYVHESTSPPVPALQNKYATSASMEAALKDDVVGDNDVPHWERPFLPTEKQDRGRLRIRVNKTLEMRKAINAENKRSMDRKILSSPRKQYTSREHRYEDLQDQENDQHQRGLTFCISPPGSELTQGHEGPEQCSMDDWGERQQRDIKSLERNDDDAHMDVGQRSYPKKPAKRKPLVVRNTRTQNIRKQVAHDIMYPKDPAWLVRRKNLQAKIAIANEFKAKAAKKARTNPGNVWTERCTDIEPERYTDIETERSIDIETERSIDIATAEESDIQTDRSVAINFTDDEMTSNISNGHDQEENFYKREMDVEEPDDDDGSSSVQCAWTTDDKCLQSRMSEGDRSADVPHAAAMTFCISPPAKGPRNSLKNVPPSLSFNDKENEDVNPNKDMNDFDDQDDYKDYKEVRQMAAEDTGNRDTGPVKKTGKRKPLVVRTTRTQNIRKQVAQQIMYPEDPPWMKRRKNMQAKVAMAQAFKTKAMKKPPTNSNYVHGGYHEDLSPRLGPRTDSQRQPYRGECGIGAPNYNMECDGQNEDVEDVVYLDQISENRRTTGSFSVLPPIQAFGETIGHHDDEDFDKEEEMTDVGSAFNTDRTLPEDSGEYMEISSNRVPGGNVGKEEHSLNEVIDDTCFENNDGPNNIPQKEDLVGQTKGPKSSQPRIPKKKSLIVRSTRTQNIRKKVAQEIMNPEDPPWVKKRKNLQEKIAMTNAFKAQSEQGKGRIGNGHLKPPLRPQLNNQHQPPRSSIPADVDFLDDQYESEMNYEKGSVLPEENGQNNIAFTISPPPLRRLPPIPQKGDQKQPPQYTIKKLPPSQKKLVIRTTRAQEIKKKALQLQAEEPETPRSDEMQENCQQHEKSPKVLPAYMAKTEPSKADDVQRVSRLKMLRNDMKSTNAILPSLPLQISNGSTSPCYSPEKSILGAMFTSPTPRVNSLDGKLYVPDSSNGKMYQKDASRGFTDEKGVSDSYETERQRLDNSLRNHWKNLIEGNLKDIINLKRQLIISREKERFAEGVLETLKLKMAMEKHAMYAQQGKGDGSFALEEKCLKYRPSNDDLRQRLIYLRAQSSSIVDKILTHKYVEVGNVPPMRTKLMIGDCFPRKGVLDLKEQYIRYRYIYSRKHSGRSLEPTFVTYGRERGRSHFAVVLIEENLYSSRRSGFIQVFRRIKEEIVEEEKTVAKQSKMTHGTERKSAIQMKSSANKASKAKTLTQRKGMSKEVSKSQTSSKGTDKRATCGARVPKAATRKPASTSQKQSKPVATPNKMAAKNAKNGNSPKKGNVKKRDVPKALNQTKTTKISADIQSGSKEDEETKVDVGVMVNTLPAAFTEAARSNDSRDSNINTKSDNSNKNVSKKSNARARSSLIKSTRIPAPTYNMRQASARRCSFDDPEEDGPWTRPTRIPAPTQSLMYSNPRRYHSIEEL